MVGLQDELDEQCEVCSGVLNSLQKVVRVRYGSARYRKRGTTFTHYPEDPVRWMHLRCLNGCGLDVVALELDKCALCSGQFFEVETSLELITGSLGEKPGEPVPTFSEEHMGYIHWACAADLTSMPVDVTGPDDGCLWPGDD